MTPATQAASRIREALEAGPTAHTPWKAKQSEVWIGSRRICSHVSAGESLGLALAWEREHVNAAYIAACSPDNLRALLAERDELQAALLASINRAPGWIHRARAALTNKD